MRMLTEYRRLVSLMLACGAGVVGPQAWPWSTGDPLLGLTTSAARASTAYFNTGTRRCGQHDLHPVQPGVLQAIHPRRPLGLMADPTAVAAVPVACSPTGSLLGAGRAAPPDVSAVRAQAAVAHRPGARLYSGVAIVGAIGTGKSSACMYPYVEQLLAHCADDPARRSRV